MAAQRQDRKFNGQLGGRVVREQKVENIACLRSTTFSHITKCYNMMAAQGQERELCSQLGGRAIRDKVRRCCLFVRVGDLCVQCSQHLFVEHEIALQHVSVCHDMASLFNWSSASPCPIPHNTHRPSCLQQMFVP
eukprot:1159178-Pelagomonas_calceolata.AAC.5